MAAVAFAVATIRYFQEDTSSVARTPRSGIALPVSSNDIRLDAWVDDSRVLPKKPLHYRLSIHNVTDSQINGVTLMAFEAPAFDVSGPNKELWRPGSVICDALPAKHVYTIEATLDAREETGKFGIGAVVGWSAESVDRWKAITLTPITVENASKRATLHALRTLTGFAKDFALPIVLALVAFALKKVEDERETSRKEFEESRAEARRAAEERRAQVQQTWTLMLPKIHENSEKYYMPLMSFASSVVRYYDGADRDPEVCFFFYLRFFGRMKTMVDAISGFYLRYREGEEIVSTIWSALLELCDARVPRTARERGQLAMLQTHMTFVQFEERIRATPAIAALAAVFLDPAKYADFVVDVKLMELFSFVLTYEVNCSYEYWYAKPEVFPEEEWHRLYADIVAAGNAGLMPSARKFTGLMGALDTYAQSVDARAQDVQLTV